MRIVCLFLISLFYCSLTFAATNYCNDANMRWGLLFNESSGAPQDCTANNVDGAISGSITQNVTGKYGKAVDMNEVNNARIDVGTAGTDTSFSYGGWFTADTNGENSGGCGGGTMVSMFANNNTRLCINASGAIVFLARWSGGTVTWTTTTTPFSAFDGSFHHVVATYNSSSTANDPVIYFDGSVVSTNNATPSGSYSSSSGQAITMFIDNATTNVGEWDGKADEVFKYNGVLNSTQVNEIMNCGLDGSQCSSGVAVRGIGGFTKIGGFTRM